MTATANSHHTTCTAKVSKTEQMEFKDNACTAEQKSTTTYLALRFADRLQVCLDGS